MNLLGIELKKQQKKIFVLCVLLPAILNLFLYISLNFRYEDYLLLHKEEYNLSCWQLIFKEQTVFYFSEICHVVAALLVYELVAVELKGNAWMLVASSDYRKNVIECKYFIGLVSFLLYFVTDYILIFFIGRAVGVSDAFDIKLFIKSLLVQFFSAAMITAFYFMIVSIVKKVTVVLPLSIVFMFLDVSAYYKENIEFHVLNPFAYISHCFRATDEDAIMIILVSMILSVLFIFVSKKMIKRSCDIVY